ncbi:PREDICTED: myosin-IIIb-like [Priapulus caudatus]|uniref:non-specific serine/threonine protein kinase n=1 Tax=Priapulus caudatus TaxID=37621 RepID=A0ABM1EC34_PRICU|nr:PREDICTED: myosin-IIIb-like [Priapulus caudatus]
MRTRIEVYAQLSSVIDFHRLPDPTNRYELLKTVGEGTYGEVFSAKDKSTGEVVAVKILENIPAVVEEVEEEYQVFRDLSRHNNIPDFHGIYLRRGRREEDDQLWFVMELCEGGSVTDLVKNLLRRKEHLEEIYIAYILKDTLKVLEHLHRHHVIHRDIKGHNILFTDDARIKLVDYGVSSHLQNTMGRRNTSVGTPFWMAPEVIACEQQLDYSYDVRCDVWSLGITAIEMADGEPPLADMHPMRALFKIPRNPPPSLKNSRDWSPTFVDFIKQCLIKDFEKRPTAERLLRHRFITQVPKDTTEIRRHLMQLIQKQVEYGRVETEPEVTTKHGKLKSKRKSKRETVMVNDLAQLEILDDDVIVQHLENRYNAGQIYTYIGDILIAVNPFCPLTIYNDETSRDYMNASKSANPPHIFGVADAAFQGMVHYKQSQCVIISGESGAGKTESANLLVQQLTMLGKAPNRTLEDRILQVNPLLEAFGNAKTGINDNSSRFGKYLEMTFTPNGKVTGACLSEYLLEKSRVISQASGERNFHIFYYIYEGLRHEKRYHLKDADRHRYLGDYQQTTRDISTISVRKVRFKAIQHCFERIGFKEQEVTSAYSILAAILQIGDIDFKRKEAKHLSDRSVVANPQQLPIAAREHGRCRRWNVARRRDGGRSRTASSSWIVNKSQHGVCEALPKFQEHVNECLSVGILDIFGFENFPRNSFEQLCINIANEQIQYYFNQHIFAWEMAEYKAEGIDGSNIDFIDNRPVLDMFLAKPMGLLALLDEESHFPKATNKSLVDKFNNNIKSQHYIRPKSDNSCTFVVQHYAGKVEYDAAGFLQKNRDYLVPEISQLLRVSDVAVVRSIFSSPLTKTGHLCTANGGGSPLGSSASSLQSLSQSPLGGSVFNIKSCSRQSGASVNGSQTRAQQTVSTYFRYSLMDLLTKMVAGTPLFVRCIKPNDEKVAGCFNKEKVRQQLRYTGVLETTKIRRMGYSHRIPFGEYLHRYAILAFAWNEKVLATRENCRILLEKLQLDNWALGKTKVFLKYYHMEQLSRMYEAHVRKVVVVQSCVRRLLVHRRICRHKRHLLRSVLLVQRVVRGWLVRKRYHLKIHDRRRAAACIQRVWRGYRVRRQHGPALRRRHMALWKLQRVIRRWLAARRKLACYRKLHASATKIQAAYRGHRVRKRISAIMEHHRRQIEGAAICIQKNYRMWKSQKIYQQMLMYKSQKETQLIYFTQQVALYGAEVYSAMMRNQHPVMVSDLVRRAQSPDVTTSQADEQRQIIERRREHIKKIGVKLPWSNSTLSPPPHESNDISGRNKRHSHVKVLVSPSEQQYYGRVNHEARWGGERDGGFYGENLSNDSNLSGVPPVNEKSASPVSDTSWDAPLRLLTPGSEYYEQNGTAQDAGFYKVPNPQPGLFHPELHDKLMTDLGNHRRMTTRPPEGAADRRRYGSGKENLANGLLSPQDAAHLSPAGSRRGPGPAGVAGESRRDSRRSALKTDPARSGRAARGGATARPNGARVQARGGRHPGRNRATRTGTGGASGATERRPVQAHGGGATPATDVDAAAAGQSPQRRPAGRPSSSTTAARAASGGGQQGAPPGTRAARDVEAYKNGINATRHQRRRRASIARGAGGGMQGAPPVGEHGAGSVGGRVSQPALHYADSDVALGVSLPGFHAPPATFDPKMAARALSPRPGGIGVKRAGQRPVPPPPSSHGLQKVNVIVHNKNCQQIYANHDVEDIDKDKNDRYDFRAFLRRTSYDPGRKTLRKTIEYHGQQVDFRRVLRKHSHHVTNVLDDL